MRIHHHLGLVVTDRESKKRYGFPETKRERRRKMGGAPARAPLAQNGAIFEYGILATSPPPEAATGYAISSSYISAVGGICDMRGKDARRKAHRRKCAMLAAAAEDPSGL